MSYSLVNSVSPCFLKAAFICLYRVFFSESLFDQRLYLNLWALSHSGSVNTTRPVIWNHFVNANKPWISKRNNVDGCKLDTGGVTENGSLCFPWHSELKYKCILGYGLRVNQGAIRKRLTLVQTCNWWSACNSTVIICWLFISFIPAALSQPE